MKEKIVNFISKLGDFLVKLSPYLIGLAVGFLVAYCQVPRIIEEYHDYSNKQIMIRVNENSTTPPIIDIQKTIE